MGDASELKGQARRGAERREAIVDAAIEVFGERGFRSSALAEVAERVGLTPAGILYHFGSKEDLLLAVLAKSDQRLNAPLERLAGVGGLDALRGAVRFAELSEAQPGLAALHVVLQVESIDPGAPAHRYFLERNRAIRRGIARTLRDAQAQGEVRADVDCTAKADEMMAFLQGAAVLWLLDRTLSLRALYSSYLDTLTSDLAP